MSRGAREQLGNGEPFADKMRRPTATLRDQKAQAAKLDADLRKPPQSPRHVGGHTTRASLLQAWEDRHAGTGAIGDGGVHRRTCQPALEALAQGSTHLDFGKWLFATDHITVRYGMQYEENAGWGS